MPVLQPDDYAVVVGISKYPGYGPARDAAHLEAPDADAGLVYDWLVSPAGGGLLPYAKGMPDDERRVWLIRSSDYVPPAERYLDAEPQYTAVRRAFKYIDYASEQNRSRGKGARVGRRLYIYMAGHGIAPDIQHGCLVAADATQRDLSNINVSGWFKWFQRVRYFDEYILWLDCCMDQQSPTVMGEAGLGGPDRAGSTPKMFQAFAAHRTKKAVEAPIRVEGKQDPEIHGCFTWALLRGLQGGAVDEDERQVTGRSLRAHLKNSMKLFMTKEQLRNPDNDQDPDVGGDEDLVFGPVWPAPPEIAVRLAFGQEAVGKSYAVLGGSPPRQVAAGTSGATVELRLPPGTYVVVAAAGLRQGIVVADEGQPPIVVAEAGDAPRTPAAKDEFTLAVTAANPATEIAVLDRRLVLDGQAALGTLSRRMRNGIYKVRARLGAEIVERVILLDRDTALDMSVALASPAPIAGTRLTHEPHMAALQSLREGDARRRDAGPAPARTETPAPAAAPAPAGTAEILVLGRYWTRRNDAGAHAPASLPHPLAGVTLRRANGRRVADLGATEVRNGDGRDPVAGMCLPVSPGGYVLRHELAGKRTCEQTLVASPGWRTEVYLRPSPPAPGARAEPEKADIGEIAVLMKPAGSAPPFDWTPDPEAELVEAARLALATGRDVLSGAPEVEERLLRRFETPMAGILGAHVLLRAIEDARKRPDAPDLGPRLALVAGAVAMLRGMVGGDHPDVEALALACPGLVPSPDTPIGTPPMFHRSWRLLVRAAKERPELVPRALWDKVRATTGMRPFLVWAADRPARQAHLKALRTRLDVAPRPRRRPAAKVLAAPASMMARGSAPGAFGGFMAEAVLLPEPASSPAITAAIPDELAAQFDLPPSALAALGD